MGGRNAQAGRLMLPLRWEQTALADLERLYGFLSATSPAAALRAIKLVRERARRIPEHPRLGHRLHEHAPREVRRVTIERYELRYEVLRDKVTILRVFHVREER